MQSPPRRLATAVFRSFLLLGASLALASCAGLAKPLTTPSETTAPAVRFAVFSDPHLYDASLGTSGTAFEDYGRVDGRLIAQGEELLETAIGMVASDKPDFLVIPGDLTKDGERASHLLMARHLAELRAAGVKVFVVPGNHDVNNPHAFGYAVDGPHRVPSVTPAEFAEIYRDCGYGDALYRDPDSLSYVAEPVPGLWLLALDSCLYGENGDSGSPRTAGAFSAKELEWISLMLRTAYWEGKTVIVTMHHGVVEHFPGQSLYFSAYLVRDWQRIARLFAQSGVRVAFTGHFHAQDVAETGDGSALFDVETGALCSYPNPVRFVRIDGGQRMEIRSARITSLPSFAAEGRDFASYSERFLRDAVMQSAVKRMRALGMRDVDAEVLGQALTNAFLANRGGDPKPSDAVGWDARRFDFMARLADPVFTNLVSGLVNGQGPADNDLTIDLSTGEWTASR